ncbi:MAG: sortase [Butyricicoccus sp.]
MEDQKAQNELSPDLPVVELGGYEYVGVISIPALELNLPVMAEWNYNRLRIAPCRQFGSSRTDDLVIAAHNYKTHFGLLKELSPGDAVTFTDMANIVNDYAVVKTDVLKPNEVDAVQNSGYDLVLYTCTLGGATRVVVFCDRVTDAETASASTTDQR